MTMNDLQKRWKRRVRDGMGEEGTAGGGRRGQWMGWKRTIREAVGEKGWGKASHAPAGSFLAWEMSYHRISIPNYFFSIQFFPSAKIMTRRVDLSVFSWVFEFFAFSLS